MSYAKALEKAASQSNDDWDYSDALKPDGFDPLTAVGSGIAGGLGGLTAGQLAAQIPGRGLLESASYPSDEASKKLYDSLKRQAERGGSTVNERTHIVGPHYNPSTRGIGDTRKSPTFLAHEMGHAKSHRRLGKKMYPALNNAARISAVAAPALTIGGYYGLKDSDPEKAKNVRNAGLAMGGLAGGAVLADEAAASIQGDRAIGKTLKRKGIEGFNRAKSRKNLAKAFGTYGAMATVPLGLAAYFTRNKKDKK